MSDDEATIERTAKRLRAARRAKHLTQTQIAEKAGVSMNYYSLVERAKKNPTTSIFARIIDAIGVTSAEILGK